MKKLLFLLLLKALLSIFVILYFDIGLAPDEAQYWTWAKHLDFGYYSKPPMIAWQIFLTTSIFGNTHLGVRFGAIILSFLLGLTIWRLAKNSGLQEKEAFWGAVAVSFSPLGMYLGVAATTDSGAILGIVLAITILAKGLYEKKVPNYFLMGLSIGLGALYKWTAFAFVPFFLLFFLGYPFLRSKKVFYLFLFSILALLPSLYWNVSHDFATFKHTFTTLGKKASQGNLGDFLLAQIALLSPLYFLFFLLAIFKRKENRALFFSSFYAAGFLVILFLSIFKKMQPNWALFFYPPGLMLIGWYLLKIHFGKLWLYVSTVLAICISLGALSIPLIQKYNIFYIPYRWSPWRQNMGWDKLASSLHHFGYDPKSDILFTDTYQMTSLLSFYTQGKVYFFNLQQNRKNQFSYFPNMAKEEGKSPYFVIAENVLEKDLNWYVEHYLAKLAPYCGEVAYLGSSPLFAPSGIAEKHMLVFKCQNYNGEVPLDPEKY